MNYRHVLFLQGPLGPFFQELAALFSRSGYITHRITFNGGDHFYAKGDHVVAFTEKPDDWPAYLAKYLEKYPIEAVFLLGDCRYYHRVAKPVCERLGVKFMVFEEGYLRPDTITLEAWGVNGHSRLDLSAEKLSQVTAHKCQSEVAMGGTMLARTRFAAVYYWAGWFSRRQYDHYQHHRAFNPVIEGAKWLRGFARKLSYTLPDCRVEQRLQQELSRKFYMVPLQVHDDSQMLYHSNYDSVEAFIAEVIHSFANEAPANTFLVLKHHPMDRGYTHYGEVIDRLGQQTGVGERLIYCHDLRLPSVYNHCLGVVTVNSTLGPSALLHKVPVKVMGSAMYDIPGLTSQCSLDDFWQHPGGVDIKRFYQYQTLIFDETQINGSFFTRLDFTCANVLTFYQQHVEQKPAVVPLLDKQPVDYLLDQSAVV